jgi:hypothetical protein
MKLSELKLFCEEPVPTGSSWSVSKRIPSNVHQVINKLIVVAEASQTLLYFYRHGGSAEVLARKKLNDALDALENNDD